MKKEDVVFPLTQYMKRLGLRLHRTTALARIQFIPKGHQNGSDKPYVSYSTVITRARIKNGPLGTEVCEVFGWYSQVKPRAHTWGVPTQRVSPDGRGPHTTEGKFGADTGGKQAERDYGGPHKQTGRPQLLCTTSNYTAVILEELYEGTTREHTKPMWQK